MKEKEVVKKLIVKKETIASMESCTGGYFASTITCVDGSSEVLKFSAVTYSNEYKIKMGVDANIINKYSVYSIETAHEMSKKISDYAKSSCALLLENHGALTTGKTLLSAFDRMEVLEQSAKLTYLARGFAKTNDISGDNLTAIALMR